jgi:hypothetical protein
MHLPKPLVICPFGAADPLAVLPQSQQVSYIRGYLADLGASSVLEEQSYFDRDYLSEFSAFYSISTAGYPNACRRLHFFSGAELTRDALTRALSGGVEDIEALQERYLGFVVIRPIPQAPLGRTVLKWYPERTPATPRVVNPSREYECNVAGLRLRVNGLAWQQQDTGVGACATVGLWTMLHASAFDDSHAIPTTAEITRSAHERASLGSRMFPSNGLTLYQIAEAIKAWGLSPLVIEGDLNKQGQDVGFQKTRFSAMCAAFVRSGYPVLVIGRLGTAGLHAICAVGFREQAAPAAAPGAPEIQDSWISHLYVHDDNIGMNVRLEIRVGANSEAELVHSAPPASAACAALGLPGITYATFTPYRLVVAVHNDLRTSADVLYQVALKAGHFIGAGAGALLMRAGHPVSGVMVGARFIRLADYLHEELPSVLGGNPAALAKVRLELIERVRPMSLHLGLVRIGDANSAPFMDILYDTTDSERNHPVFANIAYVGLARSAQQFISKLPIEQLQLGVAIDAF